MELGVQVCEEVSGWMTSATGYIHLGEVAYRHNLLFFCTSPDCVVKLLSPIKRKFLQIVNLTFKECVVRFAIWRSFLLIGESNLQSNLQPSLLA